MERRLQYALLEQVRMQTLQELRLEREIGINTYAVGEISFLSLEEHYIERVIIWVANLDTS